MFDVSGKALMVYERCQINLVSASTWTQSKCGILVFFTSPWWPSLSNSYASDDMPTCTIWPSIVVAYDVFVHSYTMNWRSDVLKSDDERQSTQFKFQLLRWTSNVIEVPAVPVALLPLYISLLYKWIVTDMYCTQNISQEPCFLEL